jgi:tripartite ATP-independent transporter DctM subunit
MTTVLLVSGLLAGIIVMMGLGMRVTYAILAIGLGGIATLLGPSQLRVAGGIMWESANSYILTSLPLYVLMAEILMRGGIARGAFDSIARLLRFLPGGAAYANVVGSAVFAAVSGSSVANAAALGTVAGPQMVRLGYSKRLTFGSIAAGGTLGILMPPSSAMIIYGSLTGVSIGQLFIAGIVPALMVSALFAFVIAVWSILRPGDAPRAAERLDMRSGVADVFALLPVLTLIGFVLGGLYAGVFSPTEAGAGGVSGALLLVLIGRSFRIRDLWGACLTTVSVTSMIVLIIAAASILKYLLAYLQVPADLTRFVTGLEIPLWGVMILITALYLFLGMFVESVTLIILTVPVLYPVLEALKVDGVWLGVYLVLMIEISLLTPPVGLNLFVLQRVPAGQTFQDITIGAMPFVIALVVATALVYSFPEIATWLPEMARQARQR